MSYTRSSTDENHNELMRKIEMIPSATVFTTHDVGRGFGDFVVGCNGYNLIVEVKTARGKLRQSQKDFRNNWKGGYLVARNEDPIIAWIEYVMQLPNLQGVRRFKDDR